MPSGSRMAMPPVPSAIAMTGGTPSRPASAVTTPATLTTVPTGAPRASTMLIVGGAVGPVVGVGVAVAVGRGVAVGLGGGAMVGDEVARGVAVGGATVAGGVGGAVAPGVGVGATVGPGLAVGAG